MRGLTIKQPWAWAIAKGLKTIENRVWATSYRGLLLIHAGVGRDEWARGMQRLSDIGVRMSPDDRTAMEVSGAIVAIAWLADCKSIEWIMQNLSRGDPALMYASGPWCWILADVQPIDPPIECKGKQGLWMPPDTIFEQLIDSPEARRILEEWKVE